MNISYAYIFIHTTTINGIQTKKCGAHNNLRLPQNTKNTSKFIYTVITRLMALLTVLTNTLNLVIYKHKIQLP